MKINIDTEDANESDHRIAPRPRRRAPDYQSTGFRLRLMTLFAALVLVLIMMKEAGKPERWQWMGFEKSGPASHSLNQAPDPHHENPLAGETPERRSSDSVRPVGRGQSAENLSTGTDWEAARFVKLETSSLGSLLLLFRTIESGASVPEPERQAVRAAWEDLRDQSDVVSSGTPETNSWPGELVLSTVDAALSGADYTVGGQKSVRNLQPFLDWAVMQRVEDATAVGHPDDAPAWIRLWDLVVGESTSAASSATSTVTSTAAVSVSRVQLMSQPESWRGRLVDIEGWVRSARYVNRPVRSLKIPGYYELWVRPADTNAGAYCLYVLHLPDRFPEVGDKHVKLNERFQADVWFFKNRNYVAADSRVQVCPLLLGQGISWQPASVTVQSATSWRPGRMLLIMMVVGLMLLAGLIAWAVKRSNVSQPFQPGASTQRVIGQTLEKLQDDPNVQTDTEKIRLLSQRLHDSGGSSKLS